ncbi:hypothetical protein SNOG_03604 [Parastagonospora nodorum SN15]|uniref:Uncharacterized protein n=1 Tax=Phaeosphaeria nodorum (strain SN15 / ATCC MYA-4574 / FGSC 10173) TaxID=321614 RepID=Q0UXB0_PHANO|nr:hypothetical protein SNOG_03604 [Parastagonospora nodorum SN15]EAT88809.1 hypothetical protein SNOG_03604 [Parastagonospora nodorum SN15]
MAVEQQQGLTETTEGKKITKSQRITGDWTPRSKDRIPWADGADPGT